MFFAVNPKECIFLITLYFVWYVIYCCVFCITHSLQQQSKQLNTCGSIPIKTLHIGVVKGSDWWMWRQLTWHCAVCFVLHTRRSCSLGKKFLLPNRKTAGSSGVRGYTICFVVAWFCYTPKARPQDPVTIIACMHIGAFPFKQSRVWLMYNTSKTEVGCNGAAP